MRARPVGSDPLQSDRAAGAGLETMSRRASRHLSRASYVLYPSLHPRLLLPLGRAPLMNRPCRRICRRGQPDPGAVTAQRRTRFLRVAAGRSQPRRLSRDRVGRGRAQDATMARCPDTAGTARPLRPINLCENVICLCRGRPRHCPQLNVTFATDLFQPANGRGLDRVRQKGDSRLERAPFVAWSNTAAKD